MTEPDVSTLLTVSQATAIIDSVPVTPRTIEVPLDEAQNLRLAADLSADRDYPPFDKSQMDGIACLSSDAASPNATLEILGEIPAGTLPTRPVSAGQALRIMTGAPLPPGADTVVPVEFLDNTSPDSVRILKPVKKGHAIAPRGSEVRAGQTVLPAGTLLGPAQLAVAATIGAATVTVYARPRVAVLTTGDEVIPYTATPGPAQIRNSNSLLLSSILWTQNCDVTDLGTAPDRPDALRQYLAEGLTYDALFITGGMSMGSYDYVPAILKELGVDLKITKIKIKPGKPFVFGTKDEGRRMKDEPAGAPASDSSFIPHPTSFVFGLPGNPVSSFVCTTLFATRLLSRLTGGPPNPLRTSTRTLSSPLPPNGPREFYQPLRLDPDGQTAHPLTWKGSADVFTLAQASALLPRPEHAPALPAGAPVHVLHFA